MSADSRDGFAYEPVYGHTSAAAHCGTTGQSPSDCKPSTDCNVTVPT